MLGEHTLGGVTQQSPRAEQIVDELLGSEHRPHPFQCLAHRRVAAESFANLRGGDFIARGERELGENLVLHESTGRGMATMTSTGIADDLDAAFASQCESLEAVADDKIGSQWTLAIAQRALEEADHAGITLDPGSGARVVGTDTHLGHEVSQDRELDPGLTQGREHLFDIPEEQTIGADDQHTLTLEREAMRVEQIGRSMQGHDGLARPRTSLDHEHPGQRGADDLVLLALDGGDDVTEATGTRRLERAEQRTLTGHHWLGLGRGHPQRGESVAEQFVLDTQQLSATGGEVTTAGQPHRRPAGGPIERLCDRCPPIHDDGILITVGDRDTSDVEALDPDSGESAGAGDSRGLDRGAPITFIVDLVTELSIDPAEAQRGVAELQLRESVHDGVVDHLSFEAGLFGTAPSHLDHGGETTRSAARGIEAGVGLIDIGLFGDEIRMWSHRLPRKRGRATVPPGRSHDRGRAVAEDAPMGIGNATRDGKPLPKPRRVPTVAEWSVAWRCAHPPRPDHSHRFRTGISSPCLPAGLPWDPRWC